MQWIFGALLLNTAAAIFVTSLINHRIRYEHVAIWSKLGRPSFLHNSPANNWRSAKYYIFSNEYKQLADTVFNNLVVIIRTNWAIQIVLMITFVIGMFFQN
jgi:hypothetical protein